MQNCTYKLPLQCFYPIKPLIGTCKIICVELHFGKHLRRANNFFRIFNHCFIRIPCRKSRFLARLRTKEH